LCCISAKRLGTKHTAARVRNPEYAIDLEKIWKDLGVDMLVNPEQETAREISRLLRFPVADDIDTFVGGRVELVSFNAFEAPDFFIGKSVSEVFRKKKPNILLAMIERKDEAIVPHGDVVFERQDIIKVMGRPAYIMDFFETIGKNTDKIKNAAIIGGGRITYYLIELLQMHSRGTNIKVVEIDKKRCGELSESFPRCDIINGDGTEDGVLSSEVADYAEAVICLTDRDEENTIIALYSLQLKKRKIIVKINHISKKIVKNLRLGSIVSPENITSEKIVQYVRRISVENKRDIAGVYKMFDNGENTVEAVEFDIDQHFSRLDRPIKDMKLKKGILIGCIVRGSNIIIPSGDSFFQAGDRVIAIAKNEKIAGPGDILSN
jgi:trk system potassium uptake protein TrkA